MTAVPRDLILRWELNTGEDWVLSASIQPAKGRIGERGKDFHVSEVGRWKRCICERGIPTPDSVPRYSGRLLRALAGYETVGGTRV